MISSPSLSLYANITNRENQQNDTPQQEGSFSEQIINLNKAIRNEYIKLSEQQQLPPASKPNPEPIKKNASKSPNKKSRQ